MKPSHIIPVRSLTAWRAYFPKDRLAAVKRPATVVWSFSLVTLLLLFALAPSARAQTVRFRAPQIRVTVPVNSQGTAILTNTVSVTTNGLVDVGGVFTINPITINVTGVPANVTTRLTDPSSNNFSGVLASRTNDYSTNLLLWVNTTNVDQGLYTFSLNAAGGATNNLFYTVQAGHIWNGQTNAAANGYGLWTDSSKWQGGVPGPGDDVIFNDWGGQTNVSLLPYITNIVGGVTNITTNFLVNCVIPGDVTIGSLRFAQTNGDTAYHTLQINEGYTLTITGTNGFSMLRDYISEIAGIGGSPTVTIIGTNSAVVVTNSNADFALLIDNQTRFYLDMARLYNFQATVNRFAMGDYHAYPNFWNIDGNMGNQGNNSVPKRFLPYVNFARTNVVRASFVDPNNYTNSYDRQYAIGFLNTAYGSGSTQPAVINLGAMNAFYADGICWVGNVQGANSITVRFNPSFLSNNPVAVFRNTDGGRMSMFAVCDGAGTNAISTNMKGFVDLGSSRGSVDALVDRVYIARDHDKILGGQNPNYQGQLTVGGGVFDANNVFLGYNEFGGHTNDVEFRGYCQGSLYVSNTAVFKVNQTLTMGYTTETDANGQPYNTWGRIIVGPGGTLMANTIVLDGGAGLSGNNQIQLTGGAQLIVSNTVASSTKKLASFSMSDSSLTLHLNSAQTTPYLYATNMTTSGALGNSIYVASLTGYSTYPVQIPLIKYDTLSGSAPALGGWPTNVTGGYVINNTTNSTIDVILSTNPPKTVIWRGNVSGNWDLSTANWVDAATLNPSTFGNGDFARFDDSATGATNVNVALIMLPGQSASIPGITVSNSALSYTFSGGTIKGGARLLKDGPGTLTINGNFESPVTISNGTVTVGAGATLGMVTVEAGTSFSNAGTVSGLDSKATLVPNSGSIIGSITLRTNAALANIGTTDGTVTLQPGTLVTNSGTMNVLVPWSVPTNAAVINNGTIVQRSSTGNSGLSVNAGGRLSGTGTFNLALNVAASDARVSIGSGGTFEVGNSIGSMAINTRFDMMTGSTNIFEVDLATTNDVVNADTVNYAGGTIVINNIGAGSFSAGQSFELFHPNYGYNYQNVTNTAGYTLVPGAPGYGLVWDTSRLREYGELSVKTTSVTPPYVTNSVWFDAATTNNILTLSWPTNNLGWMVRQQGNPLNIGLSNNWTNVFETDLSNYINITMSRATNVSYFYQLFYPTNN